MQTRFSPRQLAQPAMARSAQAIRTCVHCGFCNATCPTYRLLGDELDGPRGRIMLIKEMLEQDRPPGPSTVRHLDRCLSCLSCTTTCPSGVDYMHLVDHARSHIEQRHRRPWLERVLRVLLVAILPHARRFRTALAIGRAAAFLRHRIPGDGGLAPLRAMLEMACRVPVPRRRPPEVVPAGAGPRVVLLDACTESTLRPEIQAATLRLLARSGAQVVKAGAQGCCGALPHHLGRETRSRALARANLRAWQSLPGGPPDVILTTASGCGTSLKDYGHLLADEPAHAAMAAQMSARVREIGEFLHERGLPPVVGDVRGLRVAYQSPCSLRHGQRAHGATLALLRVAGFEVVEPREAHLCCGSAGVYNLLQPRLAAQLRDDKRAALAATSAAIVASSNIGCMVQLQGSGGPPVLHAVELLDWATGGPRPAALAADGAGARVSPN